MRPEAKKLEILLGLKSKGYNLEEGDKPEIMTMSLGGGYNLECNVMKPSTEWKIVFNDGVKTSEYPADSVYVIHTHRKDSDKLIDEYKNELKKVGISEGPSKQIDAPTKREETVSPTKKKGAGAKTKKNEPANELPGMKLPIVYPHEMEGCFMKFKQWTANNNVIPAGSEVVILGENEKGYKVTVPQAHITFDIAKDKAEVVKA